MNARNQRGDSSVGEPFQSVDTYLHEIPLGNSNLYYKTVWYFKEEGGQSREYPCGPILGLHYQKFGPKQGMKGYIERRFTKKQSRWLVRSWAHPISFETFFSHVYINPYCVVILKGHILLAQLS